MDAGKLDKNKPLVFISYAREDNESRGTRKGWLDWFCCHLKPSLEWAGIELFIDNTIITGEYSPARRQALDRASAAVLLLSHHFMNSTYIKEKELPVLIARYKVKELELFPLLLTYCSWNRLPVLYPHSDNNKQSHFLLSNLVLPEHDPDHPLDALSESKVNKVFDVTTTRILLYHAERKRDIDERQKVINKKMEKKTPVTVKNPIKQQGDDKKTSLIESIPAKSTTIVVQKPPWASAFGKDQYGTWADFAIKGITQRMRWIEPGEFLMGSPEKELDRQDDEFQHRVVITRGYWLADTTCTQALWKAVMGNNPSYFNGNNLPVENVSWEIADAFIKKCNRLLPGINLRLPTEAEWEYACRAGTTTPFSFGNTISTEEVNYDGNFSYGKDKKGVYRKKTVDVTSLPCNSWGLYQMHGNVWEWCADWYAGDYYNNSPLNDPPGPKTGPVRVLRGGWWNYDARFPRSACRNGYGPSYRDYYAGFRLARGQNQPE